MKIIGKSHPYNMHVNGSALILAVVLTSLLAVVGILFLMVARIESLSTSAISDNKELNYAVETVVARISQELVLDVPGLAGHEYYDYPDANNLWLAVLEPYRSGSNYYWRQLSDITGQLGAERLNARAAVVGEYEIITDSNSVANADADGDGVGDSRWFVLDDVTSDKGKPVYAAVRIIDNGAMLNVNTGYKFNNEPNVPLSSIDGSSLMQINLIALAGKTDSPVTLEEENYLLSARANFDQDVDPCDLYAYEQNVVWRYGEPNGPYTPFDISDELELRYRFLLNHTSIDTRLEDWCIEMREDTLSTPITSGGEPLDVWFRRVYHENSSDPNYAHRHIATTYNMDRVINPTGATLNNGKMVNVNLADTNMLFRAISAGLIDSNPSTSLVDANSMASQLAVNIVDFRDNDAQVSVFQNGGNSYYGFEVQPFISDIAFKISSTGADVATNNDFAVELYNPFNVDIPLSEFRLEFHDQDGEVAGRVNLTGYAIAADGRFVITSSSAASGAFGVTDIMSTGGGKEDVSLVLALFQALGTDPETYELSQRYDVYLIRNVSSNDIYLDRQITQDAWFNWETVKDSQEFYCRAENDWNVVYQNMAPESNTLGQQNEVVGENKNYNLAHSYGPFITIGDMAKVLTVGPGADPCSMIGEIIDSQPNEIEIRLDLQNPFLAGIFKYLTVIDPIYYGHPANETRIKGRININTAPWFVVAQLPWMTPSIAQSIISYRDNVSGGFESISDLASVPQMDFYANSSAFADVDLNGPPDLTPDDGAISDFEERDVIFSRISNLTTVRSDVFTAYILVRIGLDGPQKRYLAILDRSQVSSVNDKVEIIALHPVPDPR